MTRITFLDDSRCVAWDSRDFLKQDANGILFSLINQVNQPIKMKISQPHRALCSMLSHKPLLGGGLTRSSISSYVNLSGLNSLIFCP